MMLLRRILGRIQNKRQEESERFSTLFIFFPQNFLRNLLSSYRNMYAIVSSPFVANMPASPPLPLLVPTNRPRKFGT
jgi:hypothetical protein